MDVFLVGVATEDELELGSSDEFTDDVEDVVADDAFGGGKVTDAHFDDPAFDVGDFTPLPLLDVGLHLDVLGLPMVALHRLVEIVGPLVFQRQNIEEHGIPAIDDFFGSESGLRFLFIEDKNAVSQGDCGGIGHWWEGC